MPSTCNRVPVYVLSSLKAAENNYSQIEKEALSCIFSINKYRMSKGLEQPIGFVSHTLTAAEKKYS